LRPVPEYDLVSSPELLTEVASVEVHPFRLKAVRGHATADRGSTYLAMIFGVAAALASTQAISQTRLNRDVEAPPLSASAPISAPVPATEEANMAAPSPISLSALESIQAASQSSSESSSQTSPTPTPPQANRRKPQHRGLGIALAVVGSVSLAAGITAFAIGESSFCANEKSGGCPEARDAGLVLMPVGGAVAITGFYFTFHR